MNDHNMMSKSKTRFVVPILVILLGVTWLLNVIDVIPGIDWIWTGSLAAVGILVLAIGGLNKLTIVVGPFFIAASICSVLRQTGKLEIELHVPILTIVLGCLLLLAQLTNLPTPDILKPAHDEQSEPNDK